MRWYLYDGLGSVLGEVDPQGNITARRKYDVYGSTRTGSDAGTSKHKFVGSLGHPSEDETSLVYMRARYYDPQTGRFVSQDPSQSGNNWYTYTNNNCVNFRDFTGRTSGSIEDTNAAAVANAELDAAGGDAAAAVRSLANDLASRMNIRNYLIQMYNNALESGSEEMLQAASDQLYANTKTISIIQRAMELL